MVAVRTFEEMVAVQTFEELVAVRTFEEMVAQTEEEGSDEYPDFGWIESILAGEILQVLPQLEQEQ